MIAIKDAKWKVTIYALTHGYWWEALTEHKIGLGDRTFTQTGMADTLSGCKRNAELFRKLNKIPKKNWSYV